MSSRKPSGAQNRDRKKKENAIIATLAGSLDKFTTKRSRLELDPTPSPVETPSPTKTDESPAIEICQASSNSSLINSSVSLCETRSEDAGDSEPDTVAENTNGETQLNNSPNELDLTDPGTWPWPLPGTVRTAIVSSKVQQVTNYEFPLNSTGRRFNAYYYKSKLSNDEECPRRWLIYSIKKDCVFCLACKLDPKCSSKLAMDGYDDWQHISIHLKHHENSPVHMENIKNLIENRLKKESTVDAQTQRLVKLEVQRWKTVFKTLFAITQFLAEKNMAFRGSVDKLYQPQNGNFLSLVQLLSKFDAIMQDHVSKALRHDISDHYLSKSIQNELIQILADATMRKILTLLKQAKYYSIIADCTPDISKKEQFSLSVRFVDLSTSVMSICEFFLQFIEAEGSPGEILTDLILNHLGQLGIPIQDCRGQSYDNGSNMKGKNIGVQRRILDVNPRAFYLPCAAHSLNLVVGDAAKSSIKGINFFGFISKLYAFFAGFTQRWSVLKKFATELTLKPLAETRWESRIDSVKVLRFQLFEVYSALIELSTTMNDSDARYEATTLADYMCDFEFLTSVTVWYDILFHVVIASKKFQGIGLDISGCLIEISKVKSFFKQFRKTGFADSVLKAAELANELGIEPEFSKATARRIWKKKPQFEYEAHDDPIVDPKKKFEIEFFNTIVDTSLLKNFRTLYTVD